MPTLVICRDVLNQLNKLVIIELVVRCVEVGFDRHRFPNQIEEPEAYVPCQEICGQNTIESWQVCSPQWGGVEKTNPTHFRRRQACCELNSEVAPEAVAHDINFGLLHEVLNKKFNLAQPKCC